MLEAGLQVGTLWWREIARFVRQRSRVTGAILQPLVFWLLLARGCAHHFVPAECPRVSITRSTSTPA